MQILFAFIALLGMASAAMMYLLCAFSGHTDQQARSHQGKKRDHF